MTDLTSDDLRVVRWAIQVASNALMGSVKEGHITEEQATTMIYHFSEIENKLVNLIVDE